MIRWRFIILVLAILTTCSFQSHASTQVELPTDPHPAGRARMLDDPQRSMRVAMATALHDEQLNELELASALPKGVEQNSHFIQGASLAIEEYFQLEISYPPNAEDLKAECLAPGWETLGLFFKSFDPAATDSSDALYYIPEPIGDAILIHDPALSCYAKMRCFTKYCLAVQTAELGDWVSGEPDLAIDWFAPYHGFGLKEFQFMDHGAPGSSECACGKQTPPVGSSTSKAE